MNTIFKRALITVAASLAVGALVSACNGGSSRADDDSGYVTQAQMTAAIASAVAPLKAQISSQAATIQTLQSQLASVQSAAKLKLAVSSGGSGATTRGITYATASSTTASCTWTVQGHPDSADALTSSILSVSTCDGYYLDVSEASASGNGYIQEPHASGFAAQTYFTGTGCTGTMYVNGNSGYSVAAFIAGVVFTLNPQAGVMTPSDYSNPAYYWYVPAAAAATSVQAASTWQYQSGCNTPAQPFQMTEVRQVMQNDPTVTGAASAPRPGPVLPSNP